MVKPSAPSKGDIVWVDFDPQIGREMMKRRPALVLSSKSYNYAMGLCLLCPITSKPKGYLHEVPVEGLDRSSVVLSDQIKSFDWRDRKTVFITKASPAVMKEVVENIAALIS